MPEDDFDIYGEDEGFNVKDEVRFFVYDAQAHAEFAFARRSRSAMMSPSLKIRKQQRTRLWWERKGSVKTMTTAKNTADSRRTVARLRRKSLNQYRPPCVAQMPGPTDPLGPIPGLVQWACQVLVPPGVKTLTQCISVTCNGSVHCHLVLLCMPI